MRMGRESLLKKHMVDLITCIELHEDPRANSLIQRIKNGMEDLPAVAFYTWLKSKAMRVGFYTLLLEELRSKE